MGQGPTFSTNSPRPSIPPLHRPPHSRATPKLRIETCNLLTLSVKLADKRAANASPALTELRNGAPGSLSKVSDSDQPLAAIDRSLFYRLVLSVSASEIDDDEVDDNTHLILAGLPTQLRAIEVLAKGRQRCRRLPGLILCLTRWLDVAWREVQRLRTQLQAFVDDNGRIGRPGSKDNPDELAAEQTLAVARLSSAEGTYSPASSCSWAFSSTALPASLFACRARHSKRSRARHRRGQRANHRLAQHRHRIAALKSTPLWAHSARRPALHRRFAVPAPVTHGLSMVTPTTASKPSALLQAAWRRRHLQRRAPQNWSRSMPWRPIARIRIRIPHPHPHPHPHPQHLPSPPMPRP